MTPAEATNTPSRVPVVGILGLAMKRLVERLSGCAAVKNRVRMICTTGYIVQRRRLFDTLSIDLVLDVGANTGQFAKALRPWYRGEIISFEPVAAAFKELAKAAAADPRWSCHKLALGNADTNLDIHVAEETAFSSFLPANEYCARQFGNRGVVRGVESVPVRRLDGLLGQVCPDFHHRRVYLKLDTQGYDGQVFEGIGGERAPIVALQSEVSLIPVYEGMGHWADSVRMYERAGFCVSGMFPVTMDDNRAVEFDCLMVRNPEHRARRSSQ